MASISTTVQFAPPPTLKRSLDEYLNLQYLSILNSVHIKSSKESQPEHRDQTVSSLKQDIETTPQNLAPSGVNRRKIFKQMCRRYVPQAAVPESTPEKETNNVHLPEKSPPPKIDHVSNTVSQVPITPKAVTVSKSYQQTPTVHKNVVSEPILTLRGKEMGTVLVTSDTSRRHIFKKRCERYGNTEHQAIPPEVLQPAKVKKVDEEFDKYKPTKPIWTKPEEQKTKDVRSFPEKLVLETPDQSLQNEDLKVKIENVINIASERICIGATSRTLAYLDDEFDKFIKRLRSKGYNIEGKGGTIKKATSPNLIKLEIPVPAESKRTEFAKKSPFKPLNQRRSQKATNDGKVPIGMGYARVPARLLKTMNWKSYSNCTRKLMAAVFPRRVLATHSLTGKASPAFPDKPVKKMLDPMLINDIIMTVVDNCDVSESQVRVCITTKCADESKMLRTQEKKMRLSQSENEKENYAPYLNQKTTASLDHLINLSSTKINGKRRQV